MQPYFFPYFGYFSLINSVDKFVLYDNVKYTKKGWINRNRLIFNNKISTFSVPLKKSSDFLSIKEKNVSCDKNSIKHIGKSLNQIETNYKKEKFFDVVFPIIEKAYSYKSNNLFDFLHHSLNQVLSFLGIETEIIVSSELLVDEKLKKQEKVISICKELNCSIYVNPIGGLNLYNSEDFIKKGIELKFFSSTNIFSDKNRINNDEYLSILDLMMCIDKRKIINELQNFELI